MPQEREYTGKSLNRVDALHQDIVQNQRRIERNKQIIDNYILADPSRIDDPNFISKSDIVRSQDMVNLEKAKDFSREHFHELVDIALEDAARAGKTIIDARDFDEPQPIEVPSSDNSSFTEYSVPFVPGKQHIVEARREFVEQYCKENDIDWRTLTFDDVSKIQALPQWKDPV